MDPLEKVRLGNTEVKVTRLGMGGAPMGGLLTEAGPNIANETLKLAYEEGVRYFDTAPLYGSGKSEVFFGEFLSTLDRDSFTLSSKVGRLLDRTDTPSEVKVRFDYSRDGVLRSIEESLTRLNLDRVDVVFIHDPDNHYEEAIDTAFPTLADLRSQGVIGAIGSGMNQWEMLADFARNADFDCFLLAGRYTLLDYSALSEFLPICEKNSISVILGGPYNSGILASDLEENVTYFYETAPRHVIEKAKAIKSICDDFNIPLKAAALQFGLLHPAVAATIPGARHPREVSENVEMAGLNIPSELWQELKSERLLPEDAPTYERERD